MSRTINGNLTGKAAHGHDDINDVPTDYYKAIQTLIPQATALFPSAVAFSEWMMKIPEGHMLEYLQDIVADHKERQADIEWLGNTSDHVKVIPNRLSSVRMNINGYKATASKTWAEKHL
jgi:hypothetical protein